MNAADFPDRVRRELDLAFSGLPTGPGAPDPSAGLLVALSGGADSTALLHVAVVWARDAGRPLAAAHYHHGLRGAAADADAAWCRELCAGLDVPFHEGRRAPGEGGDAPGEDALRDLRRAWLLALLDARPELALCATGHHRDDQAETVVMRLFRGAGSDGLRGIRPVSGRFAHPLLGSGRDEIEAWLRARGLDWREDATNHDGDNLRARLRRELWPVLRDIFGPAAVTGPVRAARNLAGDAAALESLAADLLARWRAEGLDDDALPAAALAERPRAVGVRLIRAVLGAGGPSPLEERHLDGILDWTTTARSGSGLDLPGGLRVEREFDLLRFRAPDGADRPSHVDLRVREAAAADLAVPKPEAGLDPPGGLWRLTCPADALRGDPRLRPWRAGDRLAPFGMAGRKKVSDLLAERRVPLARRPEVLVAEDDEGPFWVVGLCRDERTRLLPTTRRGLTLLVERREPGSAGPAD